MPQRSKVHYLFPFLLHSADFTRMVFPLMCRQIIGVFKTVQYWMKVNTSNLLPFSRDPRERKCCAAIPPILGYQEARGYAATSDFVLFLRNPQECTGYVAIPPIFWAPEKAGVM